MKNSRKSLRNIIAAIISVVLIFNSSAYAQTYKWENLPIGGGGFVSGIITSETEKDLIYARTDVGGAYRWDAKTSTWIPLLDWVSSQETGFLGVESLVSDAKYPNRLYMLVGTGYFNGGKTAILKSEDYGETFKVIETTNQFKAHGNGIGRQTGEKLAIDPLNSNILYCGTRWNGLFRSTDAGETWKAVEGLTVTSTPNENGISFVTFDPSNNAEGKTKTIYVGISRTGKNLYKSIDGGNTFTSIEAGLPSDVMPSRGVLSDDGYLFLTYSNGAGPHGHWSVPEPMDKGSVWWYNTKTNKAKDITPKGYARPFACVSIDPKDPQRLVLSTINTWMLQDSEQNTNGDRIFITKDRGESWKDLFEKGMKSDPKGISWIKGNAIHWTGSIEFDPFNTKTVWITSGNGIFRTLDIDAENQVWQFEVKGLEEVVPIDMFSIKDGPLVSVILDYDGFINKDVYQYGTIHQPRMGSTHTIDYARLKQDVMLRAAGKMYYTIDGGKVWTEITNPKGKNGKVAVSADGKIFLHFPEKDETGYWSANKGVTWKAIKGVLTEKAQPIADPVNPNKFYIYNNEGFIMSSKDGGKSFKPGKIYTSYNNGSKIMRAVPEKESELWIPLNNNGLARTKDGGATLTKIEKVTACEAVGFGKAAPGNNFPTVFIWGTVNGTQGIFRSTDEGQNWVRVNDDAHEFGGPGNGHFIVGDMNTFGRVFMSSVGRGIIMGSEVTK